MQTIPRDAPPRIVWALEQAGLHPLLARLYAARGVRLADEVDPSLAQLLPPQSMRGAAQAAVLLADARDAGERLCVVADYDCDGATACAVALRGLTLLGFAPGQLGYVVPDRRKHGYGLTPAVVDLALAQTPQWLMTVDNGIASLDGVAYARSLGLRSIVTDHHLCALDADGVVSLPAADAIVNPNQPGCGFASKSIAGVGVVFYLLLALRAELRARRAWGDAPEPRLDSLLDLVALGTVADVVRLDANNRRLVAQGLKRMRSGRMQAGLAALLELAATPFQELGAHDLGYKIGPRINAAGRLADMRLGIECLLCDDSARAHALASQLDAINRERRDVEGSMRERALELLEERMPEGQPPAAVTLFDPGFHEGVVGIVAARLKDRVHRPAFVFALSADGCLKGSGRSITGFHLRDALDLISKRHPGMLLRFGGHAMAAGCTIEADQIDDFALAFAAVAREMLSAHQLERQLWSDGPLTPEWLNPAVVRQLDALVWGPAFEPPTFVDDVEVMQQRLVGERHLGLRLRVAGCVVDAIWFGRAEPLPARARLAFRLRLDRWDARDRVRLDIQGLAAPSI